MIPILFDAGATDFSTNGLGRLTDCISCTVTEERNGIYECEIEYPFFGRFYHDMHDNGGVIVCIHDDKHDQQPFDIYSSSAPINGVVKFYAHHISYRLGKIILEPFTSSSCADTISQLKTKSKNTNPFTFWTDKVTAASFKLEQPEVVRAVLGGQEGSVLDVFGTGEYEFDGLTVKLHADRGADNGVTIRYGKNMMNIQDTRDGSGAINAVAPYWKGREEVIYLPEIYVMDSSQTGTAYVAPLDCTSDFQDAPTYDQLREQATSYLEKYTPWEEDENVVVDFVQLWQTPEYENVASLQRVSLCDYVSIYYPELGVIHERQKVVRVVYNVLEERYDEIELGDLRASLASTIASNVADQTEKQLADFGSMMQASIDEATDWISGGLGGYVVFNRNADGQPEEILIMDTPDTATAVNVLRMNKNGIGFSTSGYNGPFTTAWTINGAFNADYITTGTLSANLIKSGVLTDLTGNNSWDMTGGQFIQKKNGIAMQMGSFSYDYVRNSYGANISIVQTTGTGLSLDGTAANGGFAKFMIHVNSGSLLPSNYVRLIMETYCGGNLDNAINNCDEIRTVRTTSASRFHNIITWRDGLRINLTNDDGAALMRFLMTPDLLQYTPGSWDLSPSKDYLQYLAASHMWQFHFASVSDSGQMNVFIENDAITVALTKNNYYKTVISSTDIKLHGISVALQSSSSRRYKHDIKLLSDSELDPHRLLSLPVRQFVFNEDNLQYEDMARKTLPGFIAEEVEQYYPAAAIHKDGVVENWDERRIIPGMLSLIQEQTKRIESLEARLDQAEKALRGNNEGIYHREVMTNDLQQNTSSIWSHKEGNRPVDQLPV